jgi:hypothetical protein
VEQRPRRTALPPEDSIGLKALKAES